MEVETPADLAKEWLAVMNRIGHAGDWKDLEARIIRAVRIHDLILARGPLQPNQVVAPQLKCPHCHAIMGRWTWVTTDDQRARVHYCELCCSVLNVEALG